MWKTLFMIFQVPSTFSRLKRSVKELQEALGRFRSHYNDHWILERHGYATPSEIRRQLKPPSRKAA
jgi:hypothetical protein